MMRWTGLALLLATPIALLTSCHRSPASELQLLRRELASWDSTAQLARDLARRGALPAVYVRQVAEVVEQGRQRVYQQKAKISSE